MRTILLFALLSLFLNVFSQHIEYTYDDAGNRISRSIISLKSAEVVDTAIQAPVEPVLGKIGNTNVRIYPNPTRGLLKIVLPEIPEGENSRLMVFDMKGLLLIDNRELKNETIVDLLTLPNGMYIIKIAIGSNMSEWKVMKE